MGTSKKSLGMPHTNLISIEETFNFPTKYHSDMLVECKLIYVFIALDDGYIYI